MNKTLRYCLPLFLAATLTAQANELKKLKVDIGGDAYVRGYSTKPTTNQKSQGFAQLFRLKLDLKNEDGISLHTRTVLSGDKWNGDGADQSVGGNSTNTSYGDGGNPLRLDYGYLNIPITNGWNVRIGRQEVEFSDCFNTCDDRHDRIMFYKYYGNYVPLIIYDKRQENQINIEKDDADMYALALYHLHETHEWALLYATLFNDDDTYIFNKVHNFSPYYKYKTDKLTAFFTWNWIGQGSAGSWYYGHHNSFATKLEYKFHEKFDISFQGILSDNGGLIADGYDTYSFVVNNDPDYNQSNTKLVTLGGFGTSTGDKQDNEHFIVTRFRYKGPKLTTALAVGKAREHVNPADYDLMIYDLQTHYQYTKSLKLKAGLALIRGDRSEEATIMQAETSF